MKSKESLRYFIAIVYRTQHPKNICQALGIWFSVRRPCDMAGHAVGCGMSEAGHLLPAVMLALENEGKQSLLFSPPAIRQDCCPSLQGQLCWSLKHSDADLMNQSSSVPSALLGAVRPILVVCLSNFSSLLRVFQRWTRRGLVGCVHWVNSPLWLCSRWASNSSRR